MKKREDIKQALASEGLAETPAKTGGRTRRETACRDKRRDYDHCPFCGSGNLVCSGVMFCTRCGAEKEFLVAGSTVSAWSIPGFLDDEEKPEKPCSCPQYRGRLWAPTLQVAKAVHCLDCGATGLHEGTCPACQKGSPRALRQRLWVSPLGARVCRRCGFRGPDLLVRIPE